METEGCCLLKLNKATDTVFLNNIIFPELQVFL